MICQELWDTCSNFLPCRSSSEFPFILVFNFFSTSSFSKIQMIRLTVVIAAMEIKILHLSQSWIGFPRKRNWKETHTHTEIFTLHAIQEILKAGCFLLGNNFLLQNAHLYQNLEQNNFTIWPTGEKRKSAKTKLHLHKN